MILAAEFRAIPSSAVKIASERRCAILVHSAWEWHITLKGKNLGNSGQEGFIWVPLSSEFRPSFPGRERNQF